MTPKLLEYIYSNLSLFEKCQEILEVGSLNINGSPRGYFKNKQYLGIDLVYGDGVDRVMSGHDLGYYFSPEAFDLVLCLECIEHDPRFWQTITEIKYVLKPKGYLVLSSPTIGFPLHCEPDYYRFTESGLKYQVSDMDLIDYQSLPDTVGCYSGILIAQKKG